MTGIFFFNKLTEATQIEIFKTFKEYYRFFASMLCSNQFTITIDANAILVAHEELSQIPLSVFKQFKTTFLKTVESIVKDFYSGYIGPEDITPEPLDRNLESHVCNTSEVCLLCGNNIPETLLNATLYKMSVVVKDRTSGLMEILDLPYNLKKQILNIELTIYYALLARVYHSCHANSINQSPSFKIQSNMYLQETNQAVVDSCNEIRKWYNKPQNISN